VELVAGEVAEVAAQVKRFRLRILHGTLWHIAYTRVLIIFFTCMDILATLFGNKQIVKLMRLFLMNAETGFDTDDISSRTKIAKTALRSDMMRLKNIGFIKQASVTKDVPAKSKKGKPTKKRVEGFILNQDFPFLSGLRLMLMSDHMVNRTEVVGRIKKAGQIKLIVLSGVFVRENEGRVDLLVVGDNIKKASLDGALKTLESEVGKELSYAVMDTNEFNYRLSMYDKFIRDILDYPHEKLIDRIGL